MIDRDRKYAEEYFNEYKQDDDIIRIIRIMEYIGPRSLLEGSQFSQGAVPLNGERRFGRTTIRSASLGDFSEIIKKACSYKED